jgi:hypothetical protein
MTSFTRPMFSFLKIGIGDAELYIANVIAAAA